MRIANDWNQVGRAMDIAVDLLPSTKLLTGYKDVQNPSIIGKVYEFITQGRKLGPI